MLATYADYQKLQGNNADGSRNPAFPVLYDKVNYMDYMLLNIWGGNWDWPDNNYWVGRKRTGGQHRVQVLRMDLRTRWATISAVHQWTWFPPRPRMPPKEWGILISCSRQTPSTR